mmetsp:Transcript_3745/g.11227  ORF Transcript_3745/g.11227 Transcript_3745/m.11227 type:complete len:238 (-) Transcript_3745:811-1524(-)
MQQASLRQTVARPAQRATLAPLAASSRRHAAPAVLHSASGTRCAGFARRAIPKISPLKRLALAASLAASVSRDRRSSWGRPVTQAPTQTPPMTTEIRTALTVPWAVRAPVARRSLSHAHRVPLRHPRGRSLAPVVRPAPSPAPAAAHAMSAPLAPILLTPAWASAWAVLTHSAVSAAAPHAPSARPATTCRGAQIQPRSSKSRPTIASPAHLVPTAACQARPSRLSACRPASGAPRT